MAGAATRKTATRMPKAKMAPKVRQMRARGLTVKEIAKKLNRSERAIYEVLRWANQGGDSIVHEIPDPKAKEDLPSEIQEMLEYTADAFEKFFNRYSGRTLQPIHKKWVEDALSHHRVLINCPPRHAKSTIFSAWFPIWLICINRNEQILICSQTDKLAKKFTNEISYHLSYNAQLIKDFGRFKPEMADSPWRPNSGELLVEGRTRETKSGDLTVQVRGAGQQILGMEATWVIVDDPVSRKHVKSETERESLSDWFHGDVLSRLEPDGKAICIGQRLHLYDLYGELAEETIASEEGEVKPRWKHINYPAIIQWPDKDQKLKAEVLWPNKWTFEALMERKADMGSSLFEAMYQQNPLPEGERLCRPAWVHGDDTHPGCLDLDRDATEMPLEFTNRVRVVSMDPSPTQYAGLIVADLDWRHGQFNCTILEVVREKMQVRDMIGHILRVLDAYNPHYFIFEQNAAQRWFLQDPTFEEVRRRVRVLPHNTTKAKGDPEFGIESLAIEFEFGRIRLPYGGASGRNMSKLLLDEAYAYPQGKTDDVLMALWFIKFNYNRLVPRNGFTGEANTATARGFRTPPRLAGGYRWQKGKVAV